MKTNTISVSILYTCISVGRQFFTPRTVEGPQDPFQEIYEIKTIFIIILKHKNTETYIENFFPMLTFTLAVPKVMVNKNAGGTKLSLETILFFSMFWQLKEES